MRLPLTLGSPTLERRDLLKNGFATVTALVGSAFAEPEQAAASAPRLAFLEGTLEGAEYSSWKFWLCITGNRAQGLVFNPATVGGAPDEFQALRLEGRLSSRLEMTAFAWKDVNHTVPVGRLQGRIR